MKNLILIPPAVLCLFLSACGDKSGSAAREDSVAAADTYSGAGRVTAVTGRSVSIAHGPIQGIGWPAMTMTFTATPELAQGVKPGDMVSFQFRRDGASYALTSLTGK